MSTHHHRAPQHGAARFVEAPDFFQYRERAHRERSRAINLAVATAWSRVTGRQSRQDRDARFWTA